MLTFVLTCVTPTLDRSVREIIIIKSTNIRCHSETFKDETFQIMITRDSLRNNIDINSTHELKVVHRKSNKDVGAI